MAGLAGAAGLAATAGTVPRVRLLTDGELQATLTPSPRPSGVADEVWELVEAYVDAIPAADWQGHAPSDLGTPTTYRMRGGRWQHVLVDTVDRRVVMVVVLNLSDREVHGHRLLDLRRP